MSSSDTVSNKQILEELQKISKLLTPAATPAEEKGFRNEFLGFLKKYQVLGLAVAFVMALYLGALVKALVQDFIMPLIGLAIPGLSNLSTLQGIVLNQIFGVGDFLVALITFIVVALVIFLIVKIAGRWNMG